MGLLPAYRSQSTVLIIFFFLFSLSQSPKHQTPVAYYHYFKNKLLPTTNHNRRFQNITTSITLHVSLRREPFPPTALGCSFLVGATYSSVSNVVRYRRLSTVLLSRSNLAGSGFSLLRPPTDRLFQDGQVDAQPLGPRLFVPSFPNGDMPRVLPRLLLSQRRRVKQQ